MTRHQTYQFVYLSLRIAMCTEYDLIISKHGLIYVYTNTLYPILITYQIGHDRRIHISLYIKLSQIYHGHRTFCLSIEIYT